MSVKSEYKKLPKKKGKVCIFPRIESGSIVEVKIIGDPTGLLYLADLVRHIAMLDQQKFGVPEGGRAHVRLAPAGDLGWHSCFVEICRADAQGTKEMPEYFEG